ncbi:MAG TPA: NAD(P)H-dependent oxidoreductase [Gaiellaceae bacterium]|nr:NAD(P)H-dependent oxidoreductase [Gaiellaceae bacterium]
MRVLAISGSLRRGSYNSALLGAAAAECPHAEFVVWRGLADIPAYDEDLDLVPPAVAELRDEIARSDAVLIATPEYNASVPGALKNALDWASRPFATNALRNKPVAVIGASQGLFGAVWAQADLRRVLATIGARVDDRELPVARAHEAFTADGRLRDPGLATILRAIVDDLICRTAQRAA